MRIELLKTAGVCLVDIQIMGNHAKVGMMILKDPNLCGRVDCLDPDSGTRHIVWIPPVDEHVNYKVEVKYGDIPS